MSDIRKQIITDANERPVAVQIDYEDWLEIARQLGLNEGAKPATDLNRHSGKLPWPVDGVDYQRSIRGEWDCTSYSTQMPSSIFSRAAWLIHCLRVTSLYPL